MNGEQTLLNFLAETVEDNYPNIVGFEYELSHVEQAARGMWHQPLKAPFGGPSGYRASALEGNAVRGIENSLGCTVSDLLQFDCSVRRSSTKVH